jgi:DnaJ family protein A protein 2
MDYYTILGVGKEASESDIKKAYYKLARENHPDKVDEKEREEATQKFQKIGEAYEILSDPEKRKIYDMYGKEGLTNTNGNPGQGFQDIFSQFFGGSSFNFGGFQNGFQNGFSGGAQNQNQRERKTKETIFPLNISLKDVFTGLRKKLKVTKKIIINKNTKEKVEVKDYEKTWKNCSKCHGHGVTMERRQIGPNMFTQSQKPCDDCSAKGYILLENYILSEITEIIEVDIPKGIKNNTSIRYENQGNTSPGSFPGDLYIVIHTPEKEKGFLRDNNNLIYKKEISLEDALCGVSFKLTTLDERELTISFDDVITPNEKRVVSKEGLNGGNLIIEFQIDFPAKISKSNKEKLRKILSI